MVRFWYLGTDGDINIETEYPEFRAWTWADLEELPEMTVDFKQPAYEEIRATFRNVVNRIKTTPFDSRRDFL